MIVGQDVEEGDKTWKEFKDKLCKLVQAEKKPGSKLEELVTLHSEVEAAADDGKHTTFRDQGIYGIQNLKALGCSGPSIVRAVLRPVGGLNPVDPIGQGILEHSNSS